MSNCELITLITTIIPGLALVIAAIQLVRHNHQSKLDRTYQMIDRFYAHYARISTSYPRFEPVTMIMPPPSKDIEIELPDSASLAERAYLFNFFEELGFYWVKGVVDKDYLKSRIPIAENYKKFLVQKGDNQYFDFDPELYPNWTRMVEDIKNPQLGFNEQIARLRK